MTADRSAGTEPSAARLDAAAALGDAVRELLDASVLTEDTPDVLLAASERIRATSVLLRGVRRSPDRASSLDDFERGIRTHNPVIGPGNGIAVPLVIRPDPAGGVAASFTAPQAYEGPPFHLHGGIASMLLDQVLAHAVLDAGHWGMTVRLNVSYRRAVPLHVPLRIEAAVSSASGRKIEVTGSITRGDDPATALVEATALFVTPREDRLQDYFGDVRMYRDRTAIGS